MQQRRHARYPDRIEWPTVLIAVAIYLGWGLLTWHHAQVPWWVLPLLGGYLVCWHGSLQHEAVHGHPTPWRALNTALAWPPLGLWLPYARYRESHLLHHRCRDLTLPGADPESFYVTRERWRALPRWRRRLLLINNTLGGRLFIGPPLLLAQYWGEALERSRLDRAGAMVWAVHAVGVVGVLLWVSAVCAMPVWLYLLAFVWPGISLSLLRSFSEHVPEADADARTRVVSASAPLRLLFLNNNYHYHHHAEPWQPWYRLGAARLRAHPRQHERVSYFTLARDFLLRPKDSPVHPLR